MLMGALYARCLNSLKIQYNYIDPFSMPKQGEHENQKTEFYRKQAKVCTNNSSRNSERGLVLLNWFPAESHHTLKGQQPSGQWRGAAKAFGTQHELVRQKSRRQ